MLHQVCHKFQLHMKATSDHSLINTMGSHQHMSNFEADFSGHCAQEGHYKYYKIESEEHAYTNEHANMVD